MVERTTRASLWHKLVWRMAVVVTALLVLFLSSATWLWDEFVGPPRPTVITWLAKLHWYGVVMLGMCVLLYIIGEAAYRAIEKAENGLEKEHKRAQEIEAQIYDGRPIFVLEIRRESNDNWLFYLRNCGHRTARYVKLQSAKSNLGRYSLRFSEISGA